MPGVLLAVGPNTSTWTLGQGMPHLAKPFWKSLEEAGRTAQIEISVLRNPELVEQLKRKMAWSIEVLSEHVSRRRPTVGYAATRRAERNEHIVRLLGKRMVRPVAG